MSVLDPLRFPLYGSRLIEASAGTGKTYTIAFLYLRLILGHGDTYAHARPLVPSEILTLTFTNAATKELRERIRARLTQAADYFEQTLPDGNDPWLAQLRAECQDPIIGAQRLRRAAEAMDEAAIHTIHAWCLKMLREHAFASGGLLQQTVLSDEDEQELRRAAVEDYWRQHGYPLSEEAAQMVQKFFASPKVLSRSLDPLLKAVDAQLFAKDTLLSPTDLPSLQELINTHEDQAKPYILFHAYFHIATKLAADKKRRGQLSNDDLLTRLREALAEEESLATRIVHQFPVALIDEFQDTDPVQYAIFRRIYQEAFVGNAPDTPALIMIGDPKQAIYSFRGADIYAYLKARREVGSLYALDTNYRSTRDVVAAINVLFSDAEQRDAGAFRFKKASENPVPFLDVQSIQTRDPKQWPPDLKKTLLIDGKTPPALTLVRLDSDEQGMGKTAYREKGAQQCAQRIAHWLNLAAGGRAGFQSESGQFSPLSARDIAILVRDKIEADEMRRALMAHNIASVYLSVRDSVFSAREAHDLLICLLACAEPDNDELRRAALATALLNQDWATLEAHNLEENVREEIIARFVTYRQLWQKQGPLPMLHRLLTDHKIPAYLLAKPGGERQLTNLLHLAEWLQQQARELDGEQALLRRFREYLDDPNGEENLLRLESEEELVRIVTIHKAKGLQYPIVMLPFLAAWKEITGKRPVVAYHDRESRLCLQLAGKDQAGEAYQLADDERLSEDVRLAYVALTRAQHALWVGVAPLKAMPTSRNSVVGKGALGYLMGFSTGVSFDEFTTRLQKMCGAEIVLESACEENNSTVARLGTDELQTARTFTDNLAARRWWVASFSALTNNLHSESRAPDQRDEPETAGEDNFLEAGREREDGGREEQGSHDYSLHAIPGSAQLGLLLHSLFEWAAEVGFHHATDKALYPDKVKVYCNRFQHQQWQPVIEKHFPHWLNTPLGLPDGQGVALAQLEENTYRAEMEFLFALKPGSTERLDRLVREHTLAGTERPHLSEQQLNGMLKGFIDLIFFHQGRYYLLDYKSNKLGKQTDDYTPEALRSAILAHRYDLQYSLYLFALHRLLQARLGTAYSYEQHIGGAVYFFLRGEGQGVFCERPPYALMAGMEKIL